MAPDRARATPRVSADARVARLRLIRTSGVGPITYRQLIERFGGAAAALEALPSLASRGGGRTPAIPDERDVLREIAAVERLDAAYWFLDDADYPPLLRELENAPPVVTTRGDRRLTERTVIGMVGARNASAAACRFARGLGSGLIGHSQKMTVAARAMAEKKTVGHRS